MTDPRRVKWILAIGIVCISFPAILFRYCDAPPLAAAFWRKGLAALVLVPLVFSSWRRGRFEPRDLCGVAPRMGGTGVLLALHFACWFLSLRYTTVASSVVLVATQPVWAALFGWIFLKESIPRRDFAAIGLSVAGAALIGSGDWGGGPRALAGDALAVVAAICAAGYLTVGRSVRDRLPLTPWLLGVYATAAVCLGSASAAVGDPFAGYGARSWLMLVLMALIPSTLGHNLLNFAVRHMQAHRVQLCVLVEPVVSTLLAALLFAEMPGPLFYPGAAMVFAAVAVILR